MRGFYSTKHPHVDRVVILIDGNNLDKSAQAFKQKFRVDYSKLLRHLTGENKLIRAYFFDCVPKEGQPGYDEKTKFLDALRAKGITIIHRPLRYKQDGTAYQKGVDVALATEMLFLCVQDAYDLAIVVSGDSDYAHAVDRVKHTGKNVHVASFRSSLSEDLRQVADKVIMLDDLAPDFEFRVPPQTPQKGL
jgi:uncharacterized LabA/DUF88 family protein